MYAIRSYYVEARIIGTAMETTSDSRHPRNGMRMSEMMPMVMIR